jgi:DNA polymerase
MPEKIKWAPDSPQSTFTGPSSPAVALHWLRERFAVERGDPAADEVVRLGRFCCVRRENDRGTRWLHEHWLEPHRGDPDLWFLALVYRVCINDGQVAGELTLPLPYDADLYLAEMRARKAEGKPTEHFGHKAYTIYAYRGFAFKPEGHVERLLKPAWQAREHFRPKPDDTCETFAKRLSKLPGVGLFYAGQVVADCKFYAPLCNAPDVMTFAVSGPGSRRGLARVLGRPINFYEHNEDQWQRDFSKLFQELAPEIEQILGAPLSASDFQSMLCEVDKFERYRVDHGELQRYVRFGEAVPKKAKARTRKTPAIEPVISTAPIVPAPHVIPELAAARNPNVPHALHHDLETRSAANLKAVGVHRYAADPTTDVLCLCYAVDDEPVQLWTPGDPVPPEFLEAASNPNWILVAHNDQFERLITQHILVPRYGFPMVPIDRRRCSMAAALAQALPGALEKAVEALSLPYPKDKAGQALMRLMAAPLAPGVWIQDPASRERLNTYCRRDVEGERAVDKALPPLTVAEQKLREIDIGINDRGFHTDGALLDAAHQVVTVAEAALQSEFQAITGLKSTNQTDKLVAWLGEHGCTVSDVQKGTLAHALRRKGLDPQVRRAIELRRQLAHASAAKVEALRAWRGQDGRVCGTLRFHGAGTGRWTGHGPQPQNFKKDGENIEAKIAAVLAGGTGLESPVEAVGEIARAMITAAPGCRLMVGDFSGIESRVLAWVSGQQSKIDAWALFDRTGNPQDEPYFRNAQRCGITGEGTRDIGKRIDLSFGFGGTIGAWQRLAPEGDETDEATILRYRENWKAEHPLTVRFWYAVQDAAINAVRNPGMDFSVRQLRYRFDPPFLRVTLPSSRSITYPFARIDGLDRFNRPKLTFLDTAGGRFEECNHGNGCWYGILVENVVQGIARDLLADALIRLEAAGYPVVLHVHDEIVCEVPDDFGTLDEFKRIVCEVPAWAEGLPIAAKARNGLRFAKVEAAPPENAPATFLEAPFVRTEPESTVAPDSEPGMPSDGLDIPEFLRREKKPAPLPDDPLKEPLPTINDTRVKLVPAAGELGLAADPPRRTYHGPAPSSPPGGEPAHVTFDDYNAGEEPKGRNTAAYIYGNEQGEPWLRVTRTSDHTFPTAHWKNGKWAKGWPPRGEPVYPFRLKECLAAPIDQPAFPCEGEKDALTAVALGFDCATCNHGGAGKWYAEHAKWFKGRRQAIIPEDNDAAGRAHAVKVAATLHSVGVQDIRIVRFPELPEHSDLSDWVALGHTREEFLARANAAPKWTTALQSAPASTFTLRAVEWIWPGRFAVGKLGIIAGLPDEGKGQILCDVAARITRGFAWPCGEGHAPQGNVILLTAEDDIEDTVAPRLVAAGADLNCIEIIRMVGEQDKERMFSLITDLDLLRQKAVEIGDVRMIQIDPISAYLGIKQMDSFRATDVRAVLGPVTELARELKVLILGIMHFNKKTDVTNVLLRISDSLAFGATSRHVYAVVNDPEHGRKLFVKGKNNLASADQKALAYSFRTRLVGTDAKTGELIWAPHIVWHQEHVDVTATEAMQAAAENKSPAARDTAKSFLEGMLSNGPIAAADIEEAAAANGIAERTLYRAKAELKIRAVKDGPMKDGQRTWQWHPPAKG